MATEARHADPSDITTFSSINIIFIRTQPFDLRDKCCGDYHARQIHTAIDNR